ncbi:regulatory protein RecX [Roseibium sp.]|uniref:regulatory protein RecX n=1 Tax=Roseibium sp. TaxID=1936156 RepID=UPI003D0A5F05
MPTKPRYKLPTEERLIRSAVHYLERYASSAANLRKVLERKVMKACAEHDRDPSDFAALIDKVVDKCTGSGLVNDRVYAETKTASLRRRGGSRRKIEAQLISKGVDKDVIQSVLEHDSGSDMDAARIFARRRRLGPFRTDGNRQQRRDKDMAAMCRAGFSFDIARRIIDAQDDADG